MTENGFDERSFEITSDMLNFITYIPDRDSDTALLMRNFLDAEPEDRAPILENLRHCINGEPYAEPDFGKDYYTAETVEKVGAALEKFYRDCSESGGDQDRLADAINGVTDTLNRLDEQSEHGLIDTYRRELLCKLINDIAEDFGYTNPQDTLDVMRQW